jgi:hypothetical protein
MTLHLRICHDGSGSWSVHGLSSQPAQHLPSLPASIDYARRQCGGAPATIELIADGFYAVVHQKDGWPRQLVAPEAETSRPVEEERGPGGNHLLMRLRQWFKRVG